MKAEILQTEFASRGIPHDGDGLFLLPPDALALVNRAADEGVPIMSVSALSPAADATGALPLQRLADFSPRTAEGHGCWEEAESVIRERSTVGAAFHLTLGDDPVEIV